LKFVSAFGSIAPITNPIKSMKLAFSLCLFLGFVFTQQTGAAEVSFNVSDCIYGWNAKYTTNGTSVNVLIKLEPQPGVSAATVNQLKTKWQDGIVNKWSNKLACPGSNQKLQFAVQFVTANQHHIVKVWPQLPRSDMGNWDANDDGNAAAHEYGHMLGIRDEYVYPNCPGRTPVNTGSVMHVVTGPIRQNHINAVCAQTQSGAGAVLADVPDKPASTASATPLLDAKDLSGKLHCTLTISGGRPGERLEYRIDVDEAAGTSTVSLLDEVSTNKDKPAQGQSAVPAKLLEDVRKLISAGALPDEKKPAQQFLPGSVVAVLKIQAGGKTQTVVYPVDEAALAESASPSAGAALDRLSVALPVPDFVKLHQVFVTEGTRVLKKAP